MTFCDIAVIGGGPAGACCASKLADLGFSVTLFDKGRGKRHHIAESLPSSIRVILNSLDIELPPSAVVTRPPQHLVYWGSMQGGSSEGMGREPSLLVWRGIFDEILRVGAVSKGVRLIDSMAYRVAQSPSGYEVFFGEEFKLGCRFLVDASGRTAIVARKYRLRESRFQTLALTAHFRTDETNPPTVVEAIPDGWIWSAPLANGLRDVTVMLEGEASHQEAIDAAPNVCDLVKETPRVGSIRAIDATPYVSSKFCDDNVIFVGDSGSFLDPLSAHGVHKAMDAGMVAAVVVRTVLERPAMERDAVEFFSQRESNIYKVTKERLSRLYRSETRFAARSFWKQRSGSKVLDEPMIPRLPLRSDMKLRSGPGVELVEAPVLEEEFIERRIVLMSPERERAVRYFGEVSLPEVFLHATRSETAAIAARNAPYPFDKAYKAIDWLYSSGYLIE